MDRNDKKWSDLRRDDVGVMKELVNGRDLARQLQLILFKEQPSSSNETCEAIIQKVIDSLQRSIEMLLGSHPLLYDEPIQPTAPAIEPADSNPYSFSGSPNNSQESDGDPKDSDHSRDEFKNTRKYFPLVKKKVKGCSSTGLQGPIEDGYSWRKYGQKDIHKAKYPRAYYRCTLRQAQGCSATKQVQRTDDDPNFFEVVYRGKHTCDQASSSSSSSLVNPTNIKLEPVETQLAYKPPLQKSHQRFLMSFKTDQPKDVIRPINTDCNKQVKSISFSFPSSSNNPTAPFVSYNSNFNDQSNFSTNYVNARQQSFQSDLMTNNFDNQSGDLAREFAALATTSASNSPDLVESKFSFDQGELHQDFMYDSPKFF